jgi:hypothetical protein
MVRQRLELREVGFGSVGARQFGDHFALGAQYHVGGNLVDAVGALHRGRSVEVDLDGHKVSLQRCPNVRLIENGLIKDPAWAARARPEMNQQQAI